MESGVYVREDGGEVFLVTLSMFRADVSAGEYDRLRVKLSFRLSQSYHKPVQILHLVLIRDIGEDDRIRELAGQVSGMWLISLKDGRIFRYENQPQEFDGLYRYLDEGFALSHKPVQFSVTPVNVCIVLGNLIYFLVIIVWNRSYDAVYDTDVMLRMGALSYHTFAEGAWYQVVTSMFMHFGLRHLANNMVLLTYVGCELERRIGGFAYAVLYFAAGIGGNLASLWHYRGSEDVVSAGASGAIFGVIGALFVVLLFFRSESETLTASRLATMTVITIYYGLTTAGVDNAAHIGGLISGIIGGFLLSKILQYVKLKRVT